MSRYIHLFLVFFYLQSFSQDINFNAFKGNPIKVEFIKEISEQKMYMYVDSTYTGASLDNQLPLLLDLIDNKNTVVAIFRYSFSSNGESYSVLKYNIKVDDADTVPKVTTILCKKQNNSWVLSDNSSFKELQIIFYVFSSITLEFYNALMNTENKLEYPEINKLKPLVKDANGVLNIEKLAEVIKENKASLSKYLDE